MISIKQLDFYFPFIVLAYGALVTLATSIPGMLKSGYRLFPQELMARLESNRVLAVICLIVGTLWSLQNIWLIGY